MTAMAHAELLDLSRDPIVVLTPQPAGTPGRVDHYHAALEWLIARGVPFVLISKADGSEASESQEDQKARALWFKSNLAALAGVCRGFVYVEADDARRAMWQARAQAMAKSFPVPMTVVADMPSAYEQAGDLLPAR
jgi:hypothetical protein